MEKHERVHRKASTIFKNNFLGGIAWGLGATVGASIVLAIFGLLIKELNLIPVVGGFVANVVKFVSENNPHLLK